LTTTDRNPLVLACAALVLAVTSPAIILVASKAGAVAGTVTSVASPLIALSILFAFAFHVRFALGALRAERRSASILASVAMLVGVTGFIASILALMGILR
jgi:hypothetical protein